MIDPWSSAIVNYEKLIEEFGIKPFHDLLGDIEDPLMGVISLLSVATLRTAFVPGGDADAFILAGRSLLAFHDWTFLLGPQFCAGFGNGLLLGYLMHRSRLVPRRMALLGLVGGPLAFSGGVAVLFGVLNPMSAGLFALTVIEIAWELSLTIYVLAKGFRPSPAFEGL